MKAATKSATIRWLGGLRFDGAGDEGSQVTMQGVEPGREPGLPPDGYRPISLLLTALAGCTAMDVISICVKKRQVVERYEVIASGEQRETHPRTFISITLEHHVWGDALDAEAVRRAVELSARRYCPVAAHISAGDTVLTHISVVHRASGEERLEVATTGPRGAGLDPVAG